MVRRGLRVRAAHEVEEEAGFADRSGERSCCSAPARIRRPARWSRSSTSSRPRSIRPPSARYAGDGSPMEEGARTRWLGLDEAIAACVRGELVGYQD